MHEVLSSIATHCATDIRVAWLLSTYCVPIATLHPNKPTRLLYLGDTQIISDVQIVVSLQIRPCVVNAFHITFLVPGLFDFLFIGLPVAKSQANAQSRNEKQHSRVV